MNNLNFNPNNVAKYELLWWQAHHIGNREKLFENLVKQLEEMYKMSQAEAEKAIGFIMLAVKYHDTENYKDAITKVEQYYLVIKNTASLNFDTKKVAELEVAWWQLHDELEVNPDKSSLAELFTKLYAAIFDIPEENLSLVGFFKALATYEHDLAEDPKTDPSRVEFHWKRTELMLQKFYEELLTQIKSSL